MLFAEQARSAEDSELVQPEKDDEDSADPGKEHSLFFEKSACCRRAEAEYEKRRADPECKEQNAEEKPAPAAFLRLFSGIAAADPALRAKSS